MARDRFASCGKMISQIRGRSGIAAEMIGIDNAAGQELARQNPQPGLRSNGISTFIFFPQSVNFQPLILLFFGRRNDFYLCVGCFQGLRAAKIIRPVQSRPLQEWRLFSRPKYDRSFL